MVVDSDAAEPAETDETGESGVEEGRNWAPFGFALAASVVVLDQLTKWLILGPFEFSPAQCRAFSAGCRQVEVLPFFDLTMVWNRGVSFGMFKAESGLGRWVLVAFLTAVAVLLGAWLRRARRPFVAVALGLVVGGAVGNLIDRARFGAVVDFLDFSGLYFPWVFNLADASITVGAAFLVLEIVLERRIKN